MRSIIFINSHPIQYFAPMYKYMNERGLNTKVWYSSDAMLGGELDKEFGVQVKWDIPLLQGYEFRFFKNYSPKPNHNGSFWGLINPGMIRALFKENKSIVIVHGYQFFTHFAVLVLAALAGHKVCLRNDVPYNHEKFKTSYKQKIRKVLLKYFVFPRIDYFMYIGTQNKQLYESYSISKSRLVFCPYAVDNERFFAAFRKSAGVKKSLKSRLGIPSDAQIILFSGKYIDTKKPLDLIKAFALINSPDYWLVMVGDGPLKGEMQKLISEEGIPNVVLTGFVNQKEIPDYYALGDLFVMCSARDNWGLSVNEAMNFDLPVVVSDLSGCSDDLVMPGVNGYTFPTGDVDALASRLKQVLVEKKLSWTNSSQQIIKRYDYSVVVEELKKINS